MRPSSEVFDTEPPETSMVNPTSGEILANKVSLSANATDNVGVSSVQFELDGKPIGNPVTKLPYAFKWDSTGASNGNHLLTALATDTSGNTAESAPVEVRVENPAPPGPCFTIDVSSTVTGGKTVQTPHFTTTVAGEKLFAFVSATGPGTKEQIAKVAGGGVKWKLVRARQLHARGRRDLVRRSRKVIKKNKFVKAS